ncbi:unnamed protein product, partial [Staurois parvus]
VPWFQPLPTSEHRPLVPAPYPPPSTIPCTIPWFQPLPTSEHCPLVPAPTHLRAPSLGFSPYSPLSTVPWFQPLLTSEHCPLVPTHYPPPSTVPWFQPLLTSEHCPLVPTPTHLRAPSLGFSHYSPLSTVP